MCFYTFNNSLTSLDNEKDVEWSIRELIYRNKTGMTIKNTDISKLLQTNYQEYKDSSADKLTQLANTVLISLSKNGILTSEGENEIEMTYTVSLMLNRYQCNECNQISYIGEKEDVKCFSCESTSLRERNVH